MKSLMVDKNRSLALVDVPVPGFDEYKALVKMEACGVCNGTDLKLVHGQFKGFNTYPAILGHEGVGRIVEKGSKVENFKIGDRVLLPFIEGKAGDYFSGWGAYSEYAVVGDWKAMAAGGRGPGTSYFSEAYYAQQVVPADIDPVAAAMIITFREVLSASKRFGFSENRSIVIFGAGPVGLSFVKFARLLGMGPVIVFDIADDKVEQARAMGAHMAFNSTKVNAVEKVKELLKEGADFVVDAVGMNQLINQAMSCVNYNGKICCYGISPKLGMELDWSSAPYNWSLHFVQWPSNLEESQAHSQVMYWIESGVLNPMDFISDVIPFGKIIDAFTMVEERKAKKKIVIRF